MKKTIFTAFSLFTLAAQAQVTLIPDQNFENYLVHYGYDSDGLINGQILTADALSVSELDFINKSPNNASHINLTGFNDFSGLETLKAQNSATILNFNNLPKLKTIYLDNPSIASFDALPLTSLERLELENTSVDVPYRKIRDLNFSNSPNFENLFARELYDLERINLRNNIANSVEITLIGGSNKVICIEVDDEVAATNNLPPYNNWSITSDGLTPYNKFYYSKTCTLNIEQFINENFKIYPNPTSDFILIDQIDLKNIDLESLQIMDSSGKWIRSVTKNLNKINVSDLSQGVYLFVLQTNKGNKTEKIIIK